MRHRPRGHPIDGALVSWTELQDAAPWSALLLGNGLSVNVWPGFAYESLYDRARSRSRVGGLSEQDDRLFRVLATTNFERVLANLKAAIRVSRASEQDPAPLERGYRRIQAALGEAIRAAHVERSAVSDLTLSRIRASLLACRCVFTTSYDLVAYWAMGYGETFDGFCDCFWSNGRNEFDERNATIWPGTTPVFFVHGALHLVVGGDGITRKLRSDDRMLLQQFARPAPRDEGARPLLVTEGASHDKRIAIEGNDYLRFALQMLRAQPDPLVIFGHSLSAQDQHLIDAINLRPNRAVAVSIFPDRRERIRARQAHIRAALGTDELYFYDSTTHPLGAPDLRSARSAGPRERARARPVVSSTTGLAFQAPGGSPGLP